MYPLGNQFIIDYTKSIANPKNIIKGQKFRITVLTVIVVLLLMHQRNLLIEGTLSNLFLLCVKIISFYKLQRNTFL